MSIKNLIKKIIIGLMAILLISVVFILIMIKNSRDNLQIKLEVDKGQQQKIIAFLKDFNKQRIEKFQSMGIKPASNTFLSADPKMVII